MYSLMIFLALVLGADDAPPKSAIAKESDFSAQIMVEQWKYDFKTEKWEKKWTPARKDGTSVYLKDGKNYAIEIKSDHAYFCNVKVVTDGKDRGTWKMEPWQTGFLTKCNKGKPFMYHKGKKEDDILSVSFTSRHTNETKTLRFKLIEDR